MNPCRPTPSRIRLAIGAKSRSGFSRFSGHGVPPAFATASDATSARMAQAIRAVGLSRRIGTVATRQPRAAENLRRSDDLAEEQRGRHRPQFAARDQRRAPALDAFSEARVLRALRIANLVRSIRCAKSRTDSAPRAGCSRPSRDARGSGDRCRPARPGLGIDRREHRRVIAPAAFPETACRPVPSSIRSKWKKLPFEARARVRMAATVAPSKPSRSNTANPAASKSCRTPRP